MLKPLITTPVVRMSKADVAEAALVQRAVVTNWIRRDLGFPDPVEDDLYHPREVADWLIRTGHGNRGKDELEQEIALYTLAGLATHYDSGDFMAAVTALICLRYLHDEADRLDEEADDVLRKVRDLAAELDPHDELLLSEVRAVPHYAGWLVSAVDDLVEAAYNCQDTFERIIAERNRFGQAAASRGGATTAFSPLLARLIAELSGAREFARRASSIVVTDPAAGAGDLLVAITHVVGEGAEPTFAGAEHDRGLARLTMRRLAVRGVQARSRDIRIGAGLADAMATPDVIVTQLPYQPAEERDAIAILAAIDDMALRLTPGRFAVVLGPADILAGDLPAAPTAERAKLLKDDMVEAIIRLPVGLVPFRPRYQTALWVLTQARGLRWSGRVLTVDVSDRELTNDIVDAIADEVVTWRRDGYQPRSHGRALAVQKAVKDLVDPPRPLMGGQARSGERERRDAANARVTRIARHGADLDLLRETATTNRHRVRAELLLAADRHPATESIGGLVTGGRLILGSGIRVNPRHLTANGTHPVAGPAEVLAPIPNGTRRIDRATFASSHPKARLTEPGDVLVTLSPRPGALVDHAGYSIAEFPVRILRIPDAERQSFTPRVLAALLFGDGRVHAGQRLEDYRVPLLPDAEVARLDDLLAEIEARRQVAQREVDILDDLRQVGIRGLIDGTLSLASDDV
jgi:hypothetical protein